MPDPEPTAPHLPEPASTLQTTVTAAPATTLPGPTAEQYRLGAEIARGGMGVVYRAEDVVFGREVAVKVLGPELAGTAAAARFVAEARITGQLQHPGVPPVHALGTLPDGRPFLVMKLIQGKTLADRLAAREAVSDDVEGFAEVFQHICDTVAFAHFRGIIHRDLKPANVMVGNFGEVQVMDWGLARAGVRSRGAGVSEDTDRLAATRSGALDPPDADDTGPESRTVAGAVMGTPAYMPPEQARGQLDRVSERSDVFALGGILCAILTGQPPYTGVSGREVLRKAEDGNLGEAFTRLSAATAELEGEEEAVVVAPLIDLARRCLSPDPARRPADAAEVATLVRSARSKIQKLRRRIELDRAVASIGPRGVPFTASRYRSVYLFGCALGLLVCALFFLYTQMFLRPR